MYWYEIESNLIPLEQEPPPGAAGRRTAYFGGIIPAAAVVRTGEGASTHARRPRCQNMQSEARSDYLSGTLILPRM